jgi:hypothetical protein
MAGIFTVWLLAKQYFKPFAAVPVLLISGLNQTIISISTEMRPYSLLFFTSTLIFYGFTKYLNESKTKYLIIIALAGLVGLYNHLLILFTIIPLILYVFWLRGAVQPAARNRLLLAFAIPLIAILPFLAYWISVQDRLASNEGRGEPAFYDSFVTALKVFFGSTEYLNFKVGTLPVMLGTICIAAVAVAKAFRLRPNPHGSHQTGLYLAILGVLVIASGLATADAHHTTVVAPRYYVTIASFAPILLVWSILLLDRFTHRILAAAYAALVFAFMIANTASFIAHEGSGTREIARDIIERAPEADILMSRCSSLRYSLVHYGAARETPPCPRESDPREWVLAETAKRDKFWMVYLETPFDEHKEGKRRKSYLVRITLEKDVNLRLVGEIRRVGSTYYGLYERLPARK